VNCNRASRRTRAADGRLHNYTVEVRAGQIASIWADEPSLPFRPIATRRRTVGCRLRAKNGSCIAAKCVAIRSLVGAGE